MVTLKRVGGVYIVKVDTMRIVFAEIGDALDFIDSVHSSKAGATL